MMWRDSGEPADTYYQIRPECDDVPKTRFKIKAGKTLSVRRWQAAFSSEGYLDIGSTLSRIQRGGVHPSIRGEVWEFLLGCFDPKSSSEERMQLRQRRRVQYAHWKEECRKLDSHVGSGTIITAPIITEDGEPIKDPLVLMQAIPSANSAVSDGAKGGKFDEHITDQKVIQWKLTLHQIEQSVGVENQLQSLASITQVLDPKLHQHLETLGGGDYLFAFRMFMVLFRREFSFCDSLYLWEMMWALEYDPDIFSLYEEPESLSEKKVGSKEKVKSIRQFGKYEQENMKNGGKGSETPLPISVFLVASVLKDKSDKLLQEARGLDDVVKILNDIAGNLDAKKACSGAMKLHRKYLKKAKKQ